MGKRGRIILVAVLLLVATGFAYWAEFGQPWYHWRSLSSWLDDYGPGPAGYKPSPKADAALRTMGPRAVPYVLNLLHATNSPAVDAAIALTVSDKWRPSAIPTNAFSKARLQFVNYVEKHTAIRFHRAIVPASWKHWQAFLAFQALGPAGKSAVPELAGLVHDPTIGYYPRIEDVNRMGPMAQIASQSTSFLTPGDSFLRGTVMRNRNPVFTDGEIAAWSLAAIGEKGVPPLREMLTNADPHLRARAAEALGLAGVAAEPAIPMLIQCLNDPDTNVRLRAADALGSAGVAAEPAIPILIQCLNDPNPDIRLRAADALGKIGKQPDQTIPALMVALSDPVIGVAEFAAKSLGRFHGLATNAIPALLVNLKSPDYRNRDSAAIALSEILPEVMTTEVLPIYLSCLKSPEVGTRNMALIALGQMHDESGLVIPPLIGALDDSDPMIRGNAAGILGRLGTAAKAAIPKLISLTSDPDSRVREVASNALKEVNLAGDNVPSR